MGGCQLGWQMADVDEADDGQAGPQTHETDEGAAQSTGWGPASSVGATNWTLDGRTLEGVGPGRHGERLRR